MFSRWALSGLFSLLLCSTALAGVIAPVTGLSASGVPGQRLLMIGGGARPGEALDRFVGWAGGEQARVLVITWASEKPKVNFNSIAADLSASHPGQVVHALSVKAGLRNPAKLKRQLDGATAVFFSGGDQTRLMKAIAKLDLLESLQNRYENGLAFGATSAGTAIMSSLMIKGGDPVEMGQGLGLLPGVIVDQHFLVRRRLERLEAVIQREAGFVGMGIDENNAVALEDGRHAQAIGPSPVTLVKCLADKDGVCVSRIQPGARFEIP